MTALKPTATRLNLMRAVVNGPSVVYLRRWGHDPDEARLGGKNVTRTYNDLRTAELVQLGPANHPSTYAPRPVQPTDAGKAWLDQHDTAD